MCDVFEKVHLKWQHVDVDVAAPCRIIAAFYLKHFKASEEI